MKKNDIIMWAAIAGGGYLAYWYITNHGPNGAAYNAAGQKMAPSYWDSWFGTATAAPAQLPPVQQPPPGQVLLPGGIPATVPPAPVTQPSTRDKVLAASGNQAALNADQWSYYLTAVKNVALTGAEFGSAFPNITDTDRGPNMTVDQFFAALHAKGLGDIVPLPRSMAFGSVRGGMPTLSTVPMRGRGRGYLQ